MPGYFSTVASTIKSKAGAAKDAVVDATAQAKQTVKDTAIATKQAGVEYMAQKQSDTLKAGQALMTPAEKQHGYDIARQSMLGEFSSSPLSGSQQCLANAKALRRRERLALVNASLISCPDHSEEAQRLRQYMDEVENMRCAKHVYIANDPDAPEDLRENPPPGFKKATVKDLKKLGLKQSMLTPKGSQFRAAVYMKDEAVWGADPKPPGVLVFRGSTPEKEDWDNNFAQGGDLDSPYYRRAVGIGNALASNNADILIAGHSLGGGMASAAQGASGLFASTYNAAGLHPNTIARYSKDIAHMHAEAGKINAYRIRGEVLTKTQEGFWGSKVAYGAVGSKHDLDPAHSEEYFEKNDKVKANKGDAYDAYLHGMDQVIAATEVQKTSDETALMKCLNGVK